VVAEPHYQREFQKWLADTGIRLRLNQSSVIESLSTTGLFPERGTKARLDQDPRRAHFVPKFFQQEFSMDVGTVRCPFCVADNDFRRMMPVGEERYACASCWHVTAPKNKNFQCQCARCIRLRARIAPVSQPAHARWQEHQNAACLSKQPVSYEIPDGLAPVSKPA
jgi:hypothetical protein